jgi:sugar phosphate isomerase/epimerase
MTAPWTVAAVLPPEPSSFAAHAHRAVAAGFTHVELPALVERHPEHLAALADAALFVACASLGEGLGASPLEERRRLLEQHKRQVSDAARLGATLVYLTPPAGEGEETRACFTEGCSLLAAFAARRMVRLAVLVVAGTCLGDVGAVLAWLERLEEVSLGLAAPCPDDVRSAGRRLAYVRLARGSSVEQALAATDFRGVVAVTSW